MSGAILPLTGSGLLLLTPGNYYLLSFIVYYYYYHLHQNNCVNDDECGRFDEVAELRSVCWLEIRGRMKTCMLSPDTLYGAYLVFRLWVNSYGFLHQPVEVSVGIVGEGEPRRRTVYLDTSKPGMTPFHRVVARRYRVPHRMITRPRFRVCDGYFEEHAAHVDVSRVGIDCPKERGDGWWEIELGDFFNGGGGGDDCEREVEMGVYEVTGGDWKGGLVLQGIELRPKHKS